MTRRQIFARNLDQLLTVVGLSRKDAAEELGIKTWVLWNPRSVYQRDSLRPYKDGVIVTGGAQ